MNIWLEIFGYIGTALVVISMMMTSVIKLRIINMCGSVVSLIYAVCVNTWPVVVLNACLICINLVQTVRQLMKRRSVLALGADAGDATVQHLFGIWQKDFQKCYPEYSLRATEEWEIHILYVGKEPVGVLLGAQNGSRFHLRALYLVPAFRTKGVTVRALKALKEKGICVVTAYGHSPKRDRTLRRLGFVAHSDTLAKAL